MLYQPIMAGRWRIKSRRPHGTDGHARHLHERSYKSVGDNSCRDVRLLFISLMAKNRIVSLLTIADAREMSSATSTRASIVQSRIAGDGQTFITGTVAHVDRNVAGRPLASIAK